MTNILGVTIFASPYLTNHAVHRYIEEPAKRLTIGWAVILTPMTLLGIVLLYLVKRTMSAPAMTRTQMVEQEVPADLSLEDTQRPELLQILDTSSQAITQVKK